MKLCVLSSGSRAGNAFVVCVGESKILIDCGISPKAIRSRLRQLGIEDGGWRAAFLTHEHSDHNQYAGEFVRATGVSPMRLTQGMTVKPNWDPDFAVRAYDCPHGDCTTAAYRISDVINGWSVMVATDLSALSEEAAEAAKHCSILALETDYDPVMLSEHRGYDAKLKDRIRASHLSNPAAVSATFGLRKARHLVAVHLSRDCNSPEKVRQAFDVHWLSNLQLTVAWDDPVMVEV